MPPKIPNHYLVAYPEININTLQYNPKNRAGGGSYFFIRWQETDHRTLAHPTLRDKLPKPPSTMASYTPLTLTPITACFAMLPSHASPAPSLRLTLGFT